MVMVARNITALVAPNRIALSAKHIPNGKPLAVFVRSTLNLIRCSCRAPNEAPWKTHFYTSLILRYACEEPFLASPFAGHTNRFG